MTETVEFEVVIPENVEVNVDGKTVTVKGEKGEIKRTFKVRGIEIEPRNGKINIHPKLKKKEFRAFCGTIRAHINNMIKAVQEGVTYRLKIVYSHFPMSVKVQGSEVVIENFLGERFPRRSKIMDGVTVEVHGPEVTVTGLDKEKVSQTAANLEQGTKIKDKDPRVFQDGLYIIDKDGKLVK